jgi:hypothetical protein
MNVMDCFYYKYDDILMEYDNKSIKFDMKEWVKKKNILPNYVKQFPM